MNVAPISFCKKLAFNVRDERYKTNLLKKIFDEYKIIATDNSCQIYNKNYASLITKSKFLLSTNTKGNRYFLYFTKDELDNNLSFFIDRKICKGYQFPRIIYTKYRFDDEVFKNTLIYGELVKDFDNNWLFLTNDIISFCGKKCTKDDKIERIKKLYFLFNNLYIRDPILDVCNFQIKRYFEYNQFNELVNDFIPNLKYNVNGLMFNSINFKQPNILLLKHFKSKYKYKKENKNNNKLFDLKEESESNNNKSITQKNNNVKENYKIGNSFTTNKIEKYQKNIYTNQNNINNSKHKDIMSIDDENLLKKEYFNFIIERTPQGIFHLICFINKNKKVFGYARINSLSKQEYLVDLLENEFKDKDLLVKCKYNNKFKKFIPIEKVDIDEPDQYIDIKKYVSLYKFKK